MICSILKKKKRSRKIREKITENPLNCYVTGWLGSWSVLHEQQAGIARHPRRLQARLLSQPQHGPVRRGRRQA